MQRCPSLAVSPIRAAHGALLAGTDHTGAPSRPGSYTCAVSSSPLSLATLPSPLHTSLLPAVARNPPLPSVSLARQEQQH